MNPSMTLEAILRYMKLYLSSYRVPTPHNLFALLPKPPAECKLAIIPNAKDDKLPEERWQKLDELTADLQKLGFKTIDIVDLREYDDGEQLYSVLLGYDVLWAAGGNTFVLRSEMRRSGFENVINKLLAEGKVYCGESAGAIVAGLTLQGAEVGDDPQLADQVIVEGLHLVDRIIAPHADSLDFPEYINHMRQLYKDSNLVTYLNDDQALIVDGSNEFVHSA